MDPAPSQLQAVFERFESGLMNQDVEDGSIPFFLVMPNSTERSMETPAQTQLSSRFNLNTGIQHIRKSVEFFADCAA